MSKPAKGYGKRGRPTWQDIKKLKMARALIDHANPADAYSSQHPKSSPRSSQLNFHRAITPEVYEKVKELLKINNLGETTKEMLEKVLHMVVARWSEGHETTRDMLTAIGYLAKLVPDFKDRQAIEDLSKKKPEDLDKELEKYGIKFTRKDDASLS